LKVEKNIESDIDELNTHKELGILTCSHTDYINLGEKEVSKILLKSPKIITYNESNEKLILNKQNNTTKD